MDSRVIILKSISKATGLPEVEINLDSPQEEQFGVYSTNVALQGSTIADSNPRDYASKLVEKLNKDYDLKKIVEVIEVAGPGFINFSLKKEVFFDVLRDIFIYKDKFGYSDIFKAQKIVVEYTDPNPFKEFHIGHLISNVTGESLCRILEANGALVWRADYFGDVGIHVAKSVWGILNKMSEDGNTLDKLSKLSLSDRVNYLGQGYALGTIKYKEDEDVKGNIERLNAVLYSVAQRMWKKEGHEPVIDYDPEKSISEDEINKVYDIYTLGRKWSLEYFETVYSRLGTKFDGYYPESKVSEEGYKLVKENLGKVFEESEGAVIFRGEKFGLHTRVFINKHNLPTYEAKEIGLAPSKYKDFAYNGSIIVVGKEVKEYFEVLIEALKQINPDLGNVTKALCTGMVNLPQGKMSSREGNVVTVTGLLDKLKEVVKERISKQYSDKEVNEISENVSIGALKYAFLKNSVGSDFVFDINTALALEGNSGPYLQYTHARCQSVLNKLGINQSGTGSDKKNDWPRIEFGQDLQLNPDELSVLRQFVYFSEIIQNAAKNYSPNLICNYLYNLAQKYNNFYNNNRILSDNDKKNDVKDGKISDFRVALTAATGQVIKNGLFILGIQAPDKM